MADITITTAATFIPEVWSGGVLEALLANVVISPQCDDRYQKFVGGIHMGDIVNVPDLTGPVAADVQTLTNMTGTITEATAVTESQNQISIGQLNAINQPIDDIANYQSKIDILAAITDRMGRLLAVKKDNYIASDNTNGLDSFTQVVGTDNVDVTGDDILRSRQYIDDANGDMDGRVAFVSPATLMSIYGIERYRNNLYSASAGTLPGNKGRGFVGRLIDVACDLYETTNLEAGSAGKKNAMMQKQAIALITQLDVTVDQRKPVNAIKTHLLAWQVYGIKKMRNTFGVEIDGK